jgi:hypothetical protein
MIDHNSSRLGGNPYGNLIVPTAFYVAELQKVGMTTHSRKLLYGLNSKACMEAGTWSIFGNNSRKAKFFLLFHY